MGKVRGAVRFDLVNDNGQVDHSLLAVDWGTLTINDQSEADADCTIRADTALLERLIKGEENAIAATLRGAIICHGNVVK